MTSFQNLSEQIQESFLKTAANVFLYHDNENRKALFQQMTNIVEKNCLINAKLREANNITERITYIHSSTDEKSESDNVLEKYENEMENINPDVSQNQHIIDFNRQIKNLLKDVELDQTEDGGDRNENDDLQFTENSVNVIDPFTKQRMTDPVKNKTCGHVYDRESVVAMLKVNPRTRCPVIGCGNKEYISIQNLEADIVLRTHLLKRRT